MTTEQPPTGDGMTCPGCGTHGAEVLTAFFAARPCPHCGLPAVTGVLKTARQRFGDGKDAE